MLKFKEKLGSILTEALEHLKKYQRAEKVLW